MPKETPTTISAKTVPFAGLSCPLQVGGSGSSLSPKLGLNRSRPAGISAERDCWLGGKKKADDRVLDARVGDRIHIQRRVNDVRLLVVEPIDGVWGEHRGHNSHSARERITSEI